MQLCAKLTFATVVIVVLSIFLSTFVIVFFTSLDKGTQPFVVCDG